jgi:hypothetical protein
MINKIATSGNRDVAVTTGPFLEVLMLTYRLSEPSRPGCSTTNTILVSIR